MTIVNTFVFKSDKIEIFISKSIETMNSNEYILNIILQDKKLKEKKFLIFFDNLKKLKLFSNTMINCIKNQFCLKCNKNLRIQLRDNIEKEVFNHGYCRKCNYEINL